MGASEPQLMNKTYDSDNFKSRVIVVLHTLNGRGGVSSVVTSFTQAGLFDDRIKLHESSGGNSIYGKIFYVIYHFIKFPFKLLLHRPQLVHIHCSSGASFYRKVPYVLLCKIFKRKIILGVHPSHFLQFYRDSPWPIRKLIHIILSLCNALGFANSALAKEFGRIFPDNPVFHLRNPINLKAYFPLAVQDHRKKQALFLGAITENKGVFDILKAIPLVLKEIPDFKFVFCGDHGINDLQEKIKKANLNNSVDIRFWVEYEEKLQLLQSSAMLLLPSYSEGFPMVILEAMACGLPVICSDVGGISEAVTDGESGLVIRPGDVTVLADRIVQLVSDKELQSKLSTEGLEIIQLYSAVRLCKELKKVYAQVVQGKM